MKKHFDRVKKAMTSAQHEIDKQAQLVDPILAVNEPVTPALIRKPEKSNGPRGRSMPSLSGPYTPVVSTANLTPSFDSVLEETPVRLSVATTAIKEEPSSPQNGNGRAQRVITPRKKVTRWKPISKKSTELLSPSVHWSNF